MGFLSSPPYFTHDASCIMLNIDWTPLVVTLSRPPTISSLKITDRSFRYASPRLWNQLPDSFPQPRQSCLDSPPYSHVSSSLSSSPFSLNHSFTLLLQAQNLPFQQILPTLKLLLSWTAFTVTGPDRTGLIMLLDLFLVRFFPINFSVCPV